MKLRIDEELGYSPEQMKLAGEFILFCADSLPIEGNFEVHIVNSREPHGITTTALYEVGNNCCKVYGKNRALADVLRSVAHEMTHMMQDQIGILKGPIRDAGGFHEDQANAKAGELIKLFAKDKPENKMIYEALVSEEQFRTLIRERLIKEDIGGILQGTSSPQKSSDTSPTSSNNEPSGPMGELKDVGSLNVSPAGLEFIKSHEGFRPFVYDDLNQTRRPLVGYESAKGTPTIGVGHAIKNSSDRERFRKYLGKTQSGKNWYENKGLDFGEYLVGGKEMGKEEALQLLAQDVPRYEKWAKKVKVPLSQNMYDALTSYAYNTGNGGISKYGVLPKLNAGDYAGAAAVIRSRPVSSKGRRLDGLVRRRAEEADMFMKDSADVIAGGPGINISGGSGVGVALVGDSQMKGGIGKALKKLFPGVNPVSKTGKQPIAFVNDPAAIKAITGAKRIILTLGGNGTRGTEAWINTIKSKAPGAKVIWIGAPPATEPTKGSNSMVSTDPNSKKYFKTKNKRRMSNNQKIKNSVESAGFTFINPVDYHNFGPSRDGIHVDREGVPFINKIKSKLLK